MVRDPMARGRLIVFTRYPEPGHTKTRLIRALGAHGAADLHRRMTEWTVQTAREASARRQIEIEICFTGSQEQQMCQWLGTDLGYRMQVGHDLGERMAHAFRLGFSEGCGRIVLIGTDCPELTGNILDKAFRLLKRHDVVIGPTLDGGYCLIGMTRFLGQLFTAIPWGTGGVLDATLAALRATKVSWFLMKRLRDIDTPEDLAAWQAGAAHRTSCRR